MYCKHCGEQIPDDVAYCPHCGKAVNALKVVEKVYNRKNKAIAGLLALFLGGLGIHRFYLGQWWGVLYLVFCWTGVPAIIAFFEALYFFFVSEETFNEIYNRRKE